MKPDPRTTLQASRKVKADYTAYLKLLRSEWLTATSPTKATAIRAATAIACNQLLPIPSFSSSMRYLHRIEKSSQKAVPQ